MEPAAAVPDGAERRDGKLVVVTREPSFQLLAAVTAHNKSGTAKSQLHERWSIQRGGETGAVGTAQLWAALCDAGGMYLVGLTSRKQLGHTCACAFSAPSR